MTAAETICHYAVQASGQRDLGLPANAGEQLKQCGDAMQASGDAIGFLYEQRSHLTGEPVSAEYACGGRPSLGPALMHLNGRVIRGRSYK